MSLFSININAAETVYEKADIKETTQFLVTITRPLKNDSTTNKSFILCGNTEETDVIVELYLFDREQQLYKAFKNTDGYSSWTIGSSGFFSKEIVLPYKGSNDLLLVAKKSDQDKNIQKSFFSIKVLDESFKDILKDMVKNSINNFFIKFNDIFK